MHIILYYYLYLYYIICIIVYVYSFCMHCSKLLANFADVDTVYTQIFLLLYTNITNMNP